MSSWLLGPTRTVIEKHCLCVARFRPSARPLSVRTPQLFRRTLPLRSDGFSLAYDSSPDDLHIPFVRESKTEQAWSTADRAVPAWPRSRLGQDGRQTESIPEPDLEIDTSVVENPVFSVFQGSVLRDADRVAAPIAAPTVRPNEITTYVESTLDAIALPLMGAVGSPKQLVPSLMGSMNLDILIPTRTRVDRRKDRKLRRLKAKEEQEAAKPVAANDRKPRRLKAKPEQEAVKPVAAKDKKQKSSLVISQPIEQELQLEAEQVRSLLQDVQEDRHKVKRKEDKHKVNDKSSIRFITTSRGKHLLKHPDQTGPKEQWQTQKAALQGKLKGEAWNPRKRISPDAIAGVRSLHESDPQLYSTERLAEYFQISPDAIRRILKSKWQPKEEEAIERRERWERRGERKWAEMASQGVRPPKKWRQRGVGSAPEGEAPSWKKGNGSIGAGGGERWIEHRSPEELFARAAEAQAQAQGSQFRGRKGVQAPRFL